MRALITDTETASLKGGIVEIAIAQVDADFNVRWEAHSLIDPEMAISAEASGVHHITDADVQDAPTIDQFMRMHGMPFDADDLVFIAHNAQFDARMLHDWLPPMRYDVCTLKLARMTWPDAPNHKLQTLRYHLGLDAGDAHSAKGDVLATLNLLRRVAEAKGLDMLGLIELCREPLSLDTYISFGKYGPLGADRKTDRGTRLIDLPMSYVRWLLGTDNLDPDLRQSLKQRL